MGMDHGGLRIMVVGLKVGLENGSPVLNIRWLSLTFIGPINEH